MLSDFIKYFRKGLFNFKVATNIDTKLGNDLFVYSNGWKARVIFTDLGFKPDYVTGYYFEFGKFDREKGSVLESDRNIMPYMGFLSDFKAEHRVGLIHSKISFSNLPIGQKVIKLTFSEYRTTEELSKISEYKVLFCKNKLGETPDPARQYFFIYKAIEE